MKFISWIELGFNLRTGYPIFKPTKAFWMSGVSNILYILISGKFMT